MDNAKEMNMDEISITDLLKKLWLRRGLLVILPIVFLILATIILLFTSVKTQSPTIFYVQLQGINNASYPNGTSFSPQDLLISEVLERAASQLKLEGNVDLRKAIQVEFGVPTTAGQHRIYKMKLAAKGLTTTDIETINNQYLAGLKSSSQRGLKITINHSLLGLSSEQAGVLANAIPRAWGDIFTQKYRVLVDTGLENVAVTQSINNLTTTSDIIAAQNTLKRLKHGLDIISSDNRLKAVVSASGLNSSDLKSDLQNFQELYFHTIFTMLFVNADSIAQTFKSELILKINEIELNIEELNRSLVDLIKFRMQNNQTVGAQDSRDAVQLGENTINQVVALANQASLSDYMQKVLTARRDLFAKKSALQTELNRASSEKIIKGSDDFSKNAGEQYSFLVQEYSSLLNNVRKITRQAYGNFYQPVGTPYVISSILPAKSKLILLLSVFLGGFLAVIIALLWPERS